MSQITNAPWLVRLEENLPMASPWQGGFLATLRQLSALDCLHPLPGAAATPTEEGFRLTQAVSLAFPPREIAAYSCSEQRLGIKLFSLGLWGPQGPLPLHFSELALSRYQQQDTALVDFIDLFHHRAMSIFFRAWRQAQDCCALDRVAQDRFSFYLDQLSGNSAAHSPSQRISQHALLSASLHLARKAISPRDLLCVLQQFFQFPFTLDEFQQGWVVLAESEQTRLGQSGTQRYLGAGAILGDASYQACHKYKLWCGPLTRDNYYRLHPTSPLLATLSEAIHRLTQQAYEWELQLIMAQEDRPELDLSGQYQLGFDTWLPSEGEQPRWLGIIYPGDAA